MRVCQPGGKQHREPRTSSSIVNQLFLLADRPLVTLADRLGVTRICLQYWKSGRTTPSILSVEEMARELGYDLVLVRRT